jgi:hypothetical protein
MSTFEIQTRPEALKNFNDTFFRIKKDKDRMWRKFRAYTSEQVLPTGVEVKSVSTGYLTYELWYKEGLDNDIETHAMNFYNFYPCAGYGSDVTKVSKDKYVFSRQNSCD